MSQQPTTDTDEEHLRHQIYQTIWHLAKIFVLHAEKVSDILQKKLKRQRIFLRIKNPY